MKVERPGRVLVRVGAPEAGGRRLEVEGEGGEGAGGAEPDEAVAAPVEPGLEPVGQPLADDAGGAVGGDDQVGSGKAELREVADLVLPLDRRRRAPAPAARAARAGSSARRPEKRWPVDRIDRAAVVDLDVVPARGGRGHRRVGLGVGLADVLQRLVGEHDAEAEGVLEPVPLVHRDLVGRVVALEQDGEVEAGGPRADDRDLHRAAGSHAGATSRRRPSAVSGASGSSSSTWSQSLQVTGLCTWSRPSQ